MPKWVAWMLVGSVATIAFFAGVRVGLPPQRER
jgi:hypothetical protein